MMENGTVFNQEGESLGHVSPMDLGTFLKAQNAQLYISSFSSDEFQQYTNWLIEHGTVMSDKRGKPGMAKFGKFWIVTGDTWKIKSLTPSALREQQEVFDYVDMGIAPTPGSLGARTMLHVWEECNLRRHTALSLAAENYLFEHAPSAVVQNNGYVGRDVPRASLMDAHFAFVSEWNEMPWGTAETFPQGASLYYPLYFAQCIVRIRSELALGLFAVRGEKNRLVWPTLPGVHVTHLWSDQIEDLRLAGCEVEVLEGFGWQSVDRTNEKWSEWIFNLRENAPNEQVEKAVKAIGVAAIGHHGMGRQHHILVSGDKYDNELDWPVVDGHRVLSDLWVHPVSDWSDAPMVHWQRRVVAKVNRKVLAFAQPYAERGRLVAIDHDGVMLVAARGDENFIRKVPFERIPPGGWSCETNHDVHYYAQRVWTSREHPHRYGRDLQRYVRNGVIV